MQRNINRRGRNACLPSIQWYAETDPGKTSIVTPWFVYTTKVLIERGSQKKENIAGGDPPPIDRGRARAREKARQDLS